MIGPEVDAPEAVGVWVTTEVMSSVEAGADDAETIEVTTLVDEGSTVTVLSDADESTTDETDDATADETDSCTDDDDWASLAVDDENKEDWALEKELDETVELVVSELKDMLRRSV